ncbi:C40 family peptidase [Streptosporangiaceae bacterium NEAU-GS5]|nr:C40 family peptidase [Streptosporangiaceae bacterium NEAU-GS5]
MAAAGSVAVLLVLPVAAAQAAPKPTAAEAKAKLKRLSAAMDKAADRYNKANEGWKKAKKQFDTLNATYKKQFDKVESLREGLVNVAISTYQVGDLTSWGAMFSSNDPETMLSGMATLNQLSVGRANRLVTYEDAIKGLRTQWDQKKTVLADARKVKDDLLDKKRDADKLVTQQTELMKDLGIFNTGNPESVGQVYTGSASGNALNALTFAYKQIGKPYRYGGTGPGSWDCSGLVQASWAAGGVSLPRTSYEMWSWGANRRVSLDALEPGDLLFHAGYGHVGLYAGDGKVVHSPQTGDVVKVVSLSEYHPIGAVRP